MTAKELVLSLFAAVITISQVPHAKALDVRVIDGDTIADSSQTFRLYGIDAPEESQTCASKTGGTWPCGRAAVAAMEQLVLHRDVTCDRRGEDGYGRVLAVCTADGVELGSAMIKAGLAWSFRKYAHEYDALEDNVRSTGIGIWQTATETPWEFRARRWNVAEQQAPSGCPIKGNISSKSERIYHAPWSRDYAKTKVSVEKGERWFCDEADAVRAGWRAARWGR